MKSGAGGLFFFVAIIFVGLLYGSSKYKASQAREKAARLARLHEAFCAALLLMAVKRPPESTQLHRELMYAGYSLAPLLRTAEIIFDSLRIAQSSPNPSTAASRIDLALREWATNDFPLRHTIPADVADELQRRFDAALRDAHTGTIFCQVQKEFEKYKTLKTEKAKRTSFEKMKAAVTAAVANPLIDSPRLIADLDVIGVEVGVSDSTGAMGMLL